MFSSVISTKELKCTESAREDGLGWQVFVDNHQYVPIKRNLLFRTLRSYHFKLCVLLFEDSKTIEADTSLNQNMFARFIAFLAALGVALATTGVDVSQLTSSSSWSCAKSYGYNFACIRVYKSSGAVDSNGPTNINNAWNAGMAHVDGYIFPCYSCGDAAGQVRFFF